MRRRHVVLLALALSLCAGATPAAADQGAQDLAQLNAQRARNGIPAAIARSADWSARCARHVGYMAATGSVTHVEDPASSAFTTAGSWAGAHAVLAWSGDTATSGWTGSASPFERAPLHLAQVLAPQLATTGIADAGGFACATTWPGYTRAAPAVTRIVTYPGNGAGIYAAETTREWPFTPAQRLGLANPTGPHLYAYAWGPDPFGNPPLVAAASLVGPAGRVPIRTVDMATPGVGVYLPDGAAIVIPVTPLTPGATYTARIAFTDGTRHRWTFSALAGAATAVPGPAAAQNPLTLRVRPTGRRLGARRSFAVAITGQAPRPGESVRVRIGSSTRLLRAGADRWFAGSLRVRVGRRAAAVRVAVRDASGRFAVERLRLRAA